ncbi:uncharacterized protein LOC135433499 [Drosophila montana]|uniref:uncharacterized protein LOC135433499 n=1 Tax=Drosophila montana TaxID=40370 RepID=UPI00313C4548
MFQLIPYDEQIFLIARRYKLKVDASRESIELLDFPKSYFFIMHRILIFMCMHGLMKSLYIFTCHYCSSVTKLPTLWHNNRFLILPPEFSPALMIPWLIYHYGFLSLRLLKFSVKVVGKRVQGEGMQTSIKLMGLSLKIAFVILCKRNYEAILKSMAI